MNRAAILGLGHHVAGRKVLNDEIEESLGLEAGWIEKRTGIRSRFWALPGDSLSEMAARAGEMALVEAGIDRASVGTLLLATSTPDHLLPPTAPLVAHRLGLAGAGAVDLAGACSGFVYAMLFADNLVRLQGRPVLVVAANILSRRINRAERASAVLFADAAGAVLVGPAGAAGASRMGVLGASLASDGSGYGLIHIPAGGGNRPFHEGLDIDETRMTIGDGREVFARAVDIMTQCSRQALASAGLRPSDIDRFVPHQANIRMMDAVRRNLGVPAPAMASTVAEYGNSSAATIPLTLSLSARLKPFRVGETLLLTAAGAGLTGGALVVGI